MDSAEEVKTDHLEDISRIREEYKDTSLQIWDIDKYKKVTEFVKQLRVTDSELIPSKDMITYEIIIKEKCCEYFNLINSNLWKNLYNTNDMNKPEFPNAYATETETVFAKSLKHMVLNDRKERGGAGTT